MYELCLLIYYPNDSQEYVKTLLNKVLYMLSYHIMVDTDVKYNPGTISKTSINASLNIPIEKNSEEEFNSTTLLINRLKSVRDLLNSIDFTKEKKENQYVLNCLSILNIPISCRLSYSDSIYENFILYNPIKHDNEIYENEFGNGCLIRQIVNPTISDYGMYINISKPYNEYTRYGYDYLHLYEHMMCVWSFKLSNEHVIETNGTTYYNGIANVYQILDSADVLKERVETFIRFYLSTRKSDTWIKLQDDLVKQIKRTNSETRTDRNLNNPGRCDGGSYSYDYNTEVFRYWSNMPFKICVVVPEKIDFSDLSFNTEPVNMIKPKCRKYEYISINALKNKNFLIKLSFEQFEELRKKHPKKYNEIMKKAGIGVDTITYCDYCDMSDCNNVLDNIVLGTNSLDSLKKVMKKSILPISNRYLSEIDLKYYNFNTVLMNLN